MCGRVHKRFSLRPEVESEEGVMKVIKALLIAIVVVGMCSYVGTYLSNDEPSRALSGPEQTESSPDHEAINEWMLSWSRAQAASVRESCLEEPGCDPAEYEPEAQPVTSFGWNGASSITPTADWAEGPRYHARANGRTVLVYLRNHTVASVYLMTDDGGRRNICRDAECRTGDDSSE